MTRYCCIYSTVRCYLWTEETYRSTYAISSVADSGIRHFGQKYGMQVAISNVPLLPIDACNFVCFEGMLYISRQQDVIGTFPKLLNILVFALKRIESYRIFSLLFAKY